MTKMLENLKTPKLLITEHYESVIRYVDILTNRSLQRYNKNDILPEIKVSKREPEDTADDYGIKGLWNNPYSKDYEYETSKMELLNVTPGMTRVHDYLELVRAKTFEKLKEAEKETLDRYEQIKDLYKYKRTDEKEMRKSLFGDRFCFVIEIDESTRRKRMIRNYVIITDFFLCDNELKFLRERFWIFDELDFKKYTLDKSHLILDERVLLLHMVESYITGLVNMQKYGSEVITISKSALFEINRIEANNYVIKPGYVNLSPQSSIDLMFIKSLTLIASSNEDRWLFSIRDLSGLKSLEYLRMEEMLLLPNSFNGLHNLIKLELKECRLSEPDSPILFDEMRNLQILKFERLVFPIDLKRLEALRIVKIVGITSYLSVLRSLNENVKILDISFINLDSIFDYYVLPNLTHLYLAYTPIRIFEEKWFTQIKSLKELKLYSICHDGLGFCRFDCLAQLEKLELQMNRISSLHDGIFSKLARLKYLDLSSNPISQLGSKVFHGLPNLEVLRLNDMRNLFIIKKDDFKGLDNLMELSLNLNRLISIDSDVFKHTPNLARLELYHGQLKLDEHMLAKLNRLKTIRMRQSDFNALNDDILECLKKSNIEIVN